MTQESNKLMCQYIDVLYCVNICYLHEKNIILNALQAAKHFHAPTLILTHGLVNLTYKLQ